MSRTPVPGAPARRYRTAVVLGTRPEAVKLAPVVRAMRSSPDLEPVVVTTGQHRELVADVLPQLGVEADVALDVMRPRQPLSSLTARLCEGLGEVLRAGAFDAVVVQGDTTTALCGALCGFYADVPVAHVEAGLRSGSRGDPFPEEVNRRVITHLSTWHFAPTLPAGVNLLREGVREQDVEVTGNTVVDNLLWVVRHGLGTSAFTPRPEGAAAPRRVLLTLHRRENQGEVMTGLARAVARLADLRDVEVVLPVHPSPAVRESLLPVLAGHPGVVVTEPLDYLHFTATLAEADLVLTDSGGVQEEAPSLDVPVLVLRRTTERAEGVRAGTAALVGTDPDVVLERALELLDDPQAHARMAAAENPFGDGLASERVVRRLAADLARRDAAPVPVPLRTAPTAPPTVAAGPALVGGFQAAR
ncbi:non-hydrolyzing UDP-N-acetylglucosamine 2-epimerase [Kineococcus sp. SYSU DK004]|uniref:non-hydrolyzing UDP-N-acetylglucosamine 2-epimerase n=1 Tax=Kineococcus sp. SYSU DK004 TaxID=3383125 RepID=UPI003D7CB82D